MPQIEIDCLLRHCTDTDIKREQAEWQAYHAVRVVKGEALRGTFNFQITGRGGVSINARNAPLFLEEVCFRAATQIRNRYGKEVCVVPIPNSDAVHGQGKPFKTLGLAERVAKLVGAPCYAKDLIRWKEPVGKTHLNERPRSFDVHKTLMKLNGESKPPIVLLDDVVTSGSQLAAAKSIIEDAGMKVAGLMAFAEVLEKGQRSDVPGWRVTRRSPGSITDWMDDFLADIV